jgi:hypothetical protein
LQFVDASALPPSHSHLELGGYIIAISFSRTDNVISYALLHLLIQLLLPLHRQLPLLSVLLAVLVVSSAGVHFLVFAPMLSVPCSFIPIAFVCCFI